MDIEKNDMKKKSERIFLCMYTNVLYWEGFLKTMSK